MFHGGVLICHAQGVYRLIKKKLDNFITLRHPVFAGTAASQSPSPASATGSPASATGSRSSASPTKVIIV